MWIAPVRIASVIIVVLVAQRGSTEIGRDAVETAHQRKAARAQFHEAYELDGGGRVESLTILTPFRRAVLTAQSQAEQGTAPSISAISELIAREPYGLTVDAIIRLDPRHAYVRTPDYSLAVIDNDGWRFPVAVERTARDSRGLPIPAAAIGGRVSMRSVEVRAHFGVTPGRSLCCRIAVLDADGRTVLVRAIPPRLR
jgi:hypothetical protein